MTIAAAHQMAGSPSANSEAPSWLAELVRLRQPSLAVSRAEASPSEGYPPYERPDSRCAPGREEPS